MKVTGLLQLLSASRAQVQLTPETSQFPATLLNPRISAVIWLLSLSLYRLQSHDSVQGREVCLIKSAQKSNHEWNVMLSVFVPHSFENSSVTWLPLKCQRFVALNSSGAFFHKASTKNKMEHMMKLIVSDSDSEIPSVAVYIINKQWQIVVRASAAAGMNLCRSCSVAAARFVFDPKPDQCFGGGIVSLMVSVFDWTLKALYRVQIWVSHVCLAADSLLSLFISSNKDRRKLLDLNLDQNWKLVGCLFRPINPKRGSWKCSVVVPK